MIHRLWKRYLDHLRDQTGQALPAVLALLAISSLIMVPYLNQIATNIKLQKLNEGHVIGFYSAEAGVEDACWEILNNPPESLPYSYALNEINGMSVNVTIAEVTQVAGQEVGPDGVHEGWIKLTKSVTFVPDIYTYTYTIENNGGGNMKVEQIRVDLPPNLEYDSTSGNISFTDPQIIGNSNTGITLFWDIPLPYYPLGPGESQNQVFRLLGDSEVQGVEGHTFVKATREDVGTVWDADSKPYSVISQARNTQGEIVATVEAGVWAGQGNLEISYWFVN